MAESPAAVLAMPHWFEVADFVAIGCNDLMQCLFAADRDLAEVRRHLDPYSPELFRFLKQAAEAAGDNINKVQLCGLLPQLPGVLPVLLGMGFRVFSVAPVMIPYLAKIASETNFLRQKHLLNTSVWQRTVRRCAGFVKYNKKGRCDCCTVRINGFRLGETEVTQKQWQLVMGSAPSYFKACDNCPVDSVSWNDVQAFFKKLNQQTGLRFRLASEAEWEYACRSAGKDETYCGGDDENKLAWYGSNSDEKTHSVAQKQANGLGLYDMSGNVWEWTQDCWHDSYDGASSNGQAWVSGSCAQHILRGGSWIGVAGSLSSTGRFGSSAAKGSRNFGFRVAQDI